VEVRSAFGNSSPPGLIYRPYHYHSIDHCLQKHSLSFDWQGHFMVLCLQRLDLFLLPMVLVSLFLRLPLQWLIHRLLIICHN
jgi:hypothetical protein